MGIGGLELLDQSLVTTNPDLFSDTHTLFLSILILNSQFVGVAKEVNIKRVLGLIPIFL